MGEVRIDHEGMVRLRFDDDDFGGQINVHGCSGMRVKGRPVERTSQG